MATATKKATRKKWYVVWKGRQPGIFRTWDDCRQQVDGFSCPKFKSYRTEAEAIKAFGGGSMASVHGAQTGRKRKPTSQKLNPDQSPIRKASTRTGKRQDKRPRVAKQQMLPMDLKPDFDGLVVDGAYNTRTGDFEYQGVYLHDRRTAFKSAVLPQGTNNLAEFLGLVAGLRHVADTGLQCVVYSDSQVAIAWVREKKHKCGPVIEGLVTDEVAKLTQDAVDWLHANPNHAKVLQWRTRHWGENPADYGRK